MDTNALSLAFAFGVQLVGTVWAAARWKAALDQNTIAVRELTRRLEQALDEDWAATLGQLNPSLVLPASVRLR